MVEMLSSHFSLDELTVSEMAARRGWGNTPNPDTLANLRSLAMILEDIRAALHAQTASVLPLIITSGYRSPVLNAAVGGSVMSRHTIGCAADFICPRFGSPLAVASAIAMRGIAFDQLIHEYGRWVHVGVVPIGSRRGPRGMVLTIDRLGTRPGLLEVRS